MAVPPTSNDLSEEAIKALFAAEAANLSYSGTAAMRGGSAPGRTTLRAIEKRRMIHAAAARAGPHAVQPAPQHQVHKIVPSRSKADIITTNNGGINDDFMPIKPKVTLPIDSTGARILPSLYQPDRKPINHFAKSAPAPPVRRRGPPPRPSQQHYVPPSQRAKPFPASGDVCNQQRIPAPLRNRPCIIPAQPMTPSRAGPQKPLPKFAATPPNAAVIEPYRNMGASKHAPPHLRVLAEIKKEEPKKAEKAEARGAIMWSGAVESDETAAKLR